MNKNKWTKIILSTLLFFYLFNVFSESTYAKEGDFYNQYKTQIEREVKDKDKREFIKSYDYATNSFKCGTFDVMCMFKGINYSITIGMIKVTYSGLKSAVMEPSEITGNSTFKKYKQGFSTLSTTMLAIFLMWQVMRIVAQRFADADDGLIAINDKLLMTFVAGILLALYDKFYVWVLNFQALAVKQVITETIKVEEVVLITFLKGSLYGEGLAYIIMIAIFLFSIVIMYRFILFGFLYITGVIAIPTAVNDEYNYFSLWLRLIINNGVTLLLQVLAFTLGFNALVKNNAFNDGTSFTVSMAFFMLAVAIPSLLGNFGASSGASRGIGSAIRYIARRR